MALNKKIGYGFVISIDPTGGTSWDALGNVVDGFSGPNSQARAVDTSVLSDFWDTFLKEGANPGQLTFDVAYDPDDTDYQALCTALESTSTTLAAFKIDPPGSTNDQILSGLVIGIGPEVRKGQLAKAAVTIQVSGDPDHA